MPAAQPRHDSHLLAVLVTDGVTPWFPDTLAALAEQHTPCDRYLIATVDANAAGEVRDLVAESGLIGAEVVALEGATTFGAAVRAALREVPARPGDWLWLLHDDSAPAPDALTHQLRAADQGPSVVMVGAKQVEWFTPDQVISVGVGLTRSGRRFTGLEDGEIDQGQYDHVSDVLSLPTAGLLVKREVWEDLRGPDPALGPYHDGADLARRARLAGHRVVVAPHAAIRHVRASYQGMRPNLAVEAADPMRSWLERRRALLYFRLASASTFGALVSFIWMYLAAPLRALGRIATKEFSLIAAEFRAPLVVTGNLGALRRARAQARATATLPRRVLRNLEVSVGTRVSAWRDARLHRAAVRRAARARSELEIAEANALARNRRLALTCVMVALLAVSAASLIGWVSGDGLIGGALLPVDATFDQLWTQATSSWLAVGDGHAALADPFGLILAGLTTLIGGFWGVPASAVIAVIMVGGIVLSGLGAWFAAGAATRSLLGRAWVAGAWALGPALLVALSGGRIGAVLAHIMLPWVAMGVVRALGVQRRDVVLSGMVGARRVHAAASDEAAAELAVREVDPTPRVGSISAAAAAGLALAVAAAGSPVLLPLAILVILALVALLPRAKSGSIAGRFRLLLVPIPALALLGPWLLMPILTGQGWQASARLVMSEPGLATSYEPAAAWEVLLGWPRSPEAISALTPSLALVVAVLLGGGVVAGAVLALLRGGSVAHGVRIAWVVALLGLAAALAIHLVPIAVTDGVVAAAWPGPAVSVMSTGFLIATALGWEGMAGRLGSGAFGWRQATSALVVAALAIGPAVGALSWVWAVRSDEDPLLVAQRGSDPVPALGQQVQASDAAARVLSIVPTGDGYDIQLWRGNGPQLIDGNVATNTLSGPVLNPTVDADDAANEALALTVAQLSVSSPDAVDGLAQHAIAVVVIPPADSRVRPGRDDVAAARLAAQLDGTPGLERVTTNDSGTIWRVESQEAVARAQVLDASGLGDTSVQEGSRDLPPGGLTADLVSASGVLDSSQSERIVVLAERADAGWRAWIDGQELEPVDLDWRAAFEVPAGASGELVLSYEEPSRLPWTILQITALVLMGLLALPIRRRSSDGEAI